jgi:hypothetical protein
MKGKIMTVLVKQFDVQMEVKTNGIEFEVRDNDGTHLGDLILTKKWLIWCPGRTTRRKGKKVLLTDIIDYFEHRN